MSWTIERRGRVAVVTMTTNPVNAQNRAFFADLNEAFDRLECDDADSPVVLTGTGARFSAGLDLADRHPHARRLRPVTRLGRAGRGPDEPARGDLLSRGAPPRRGESLGGWDGRDVPCRAARRRAGHVRPFGPVARWWADDQR